MHVSDDPARGQDTLLRFLRVPAALRELDRFVLWRKEPRHPGEPATKVPHNARTLGKAQSNNAATWSSFAVTLAALSANRRRFNGIGFVLHDDAPFFGVDLDNCRDPATGIIHPQAQRIIKLFGTYSEISQSMRGVKMIAGGTMPTPDGSGKNYRKDPWGTGEGGIEFYRRGRFFALTGNVVDGTPNTVEERTVELASLYHRLYPKPNPNFAHVRNITVADADAARRCANYVAKLPASESGKGGHDRLLHAACMTLRFGLSDPSALSILHDFNRRAIPPWRESDVERKLNEAHKLVGGEFGCMLAENRNLVPNRQRAADFSGATRRNWTIAATIGGES